MVRRCAVLVFSAGVVLAGAVSPAAAINITFDFTDCGAITAPAPSPPTPCPGDTLTPTLTYTVSGVSLTVNGFSGLGPSAPPNNLFIKTEGGGESGLGLSAQTANEIQMGTFIQLNTSGLPAGLGTISIGSVQDSEMFKVCLGDTSGTFGSKDCLSGTGPFPPNDIATISVPFNVPGFPFVDITASNGDVLVGEINPAPEPSTLALLLTGAAGLAFARKPKRVNRSGSSP
jgi:hypothetical protein